MHIHQWARWSEKSSLLCNEGSAKLYTTRLFSPCWSLKLSLLFLFFLSEQLTCQHESVHCCRQHNSAHKLNCSSAYLCQGRRCEDTVGWSFFPSAVFVNMLIPQRRHERDLKCLITRMRHRWVAASKKPTFSNWALFANAVNNGAPIERKYLFKSREQSQKYWNKMVHHYSPTPCPPHPTFIPVPC